MLLRSPFLDPMGLMGPWGSWAHDPHGAHGNDSPSVQRSETLHHFCCYRAIPENGEHNRCFVETLGGMVELLSSVFDKRRAAHGIAIPDVQREPRLQQTMTDRSTQEAGSQQREGRHQWLPIPGNRGVPLAKKG